MNWRAASGRSSGGDGYRFGDLTRSIGRAVQAGAAQGWAEASSRVGGPHGYVFGDVTRTVLNSLFSDVENNNAVSGSMPPAIPPMFARDISDLPPAGQNALASLAPHLKGLWLAFFNATHHVGQQAIAAGELDPDDVESMEPSVLLGLPALAALECAIDSAPFCAASRGEPDDDANDGLVLRTLVDSAGAAHIIRPRDFPDGPTDLYRELRRLARLVGGSRLSLAGVRLLRSRTRSSSGSEAAGVSGAEGALSEEESSQINALVAIAQRIAVVVSQSPPYKAVFGAVTEAILAHAAARRME